MAKRFQVDWDAAAPAAQNARSKLPPLIVEYFAEGRQLFAADATSAALHRFRIETKHLRYTLEMFGECYGPGLEARLERLRGLQQSLGDLNDCVTTRELLRGRRGLVPAEQRRLNHFLEQRTASLTRKARRYWKRVFDRTGQERWWTAYLARPRQR